MARWTNLNAWLNDPNIKGVLNDIDHLKTRFVGTETANKAYNKLVDDGAKMHQLEGALGRYEALVRKFGFGNPVITEVGHGTYQIVFYPSDSSIKLDAADCPSLVISATTENGVTINQSLPSVNLPVWVRNAKGQVGLTSALAAGIDDAIDDLQQRFDYLKKNQGDMKSLGKAIYRSTRKSISGVTHSNPAITTRNQAQDFKEATTLGNIGDLRREAIAVMSGQSLVSFYNRSLYSQYKGKMYGAGAPKNERDFHRQLEDLKNGARNYSDIRSLSSYVRSRFPWIYNNIWKGELENLYTAAYNVGVKQGTKKEGSLGIISLFDVPTAGSNIAPLASNKPAKNLRIYQKTANQARGKSGSNYVMTRQQQSLYTSSEMKKGSHARPVYYSGNLTDKDIMAAAMDMIKEGKQIPLDALKGVTADGSVYAAQIVKDFRQEVMRTSRVSAGTIQAGLRARAQRWLEKNSSSALKSIDQVLSDPSLNAEREKWTKSILSRELGLGKGSKLQGYSVEDGKYIATVKETLSNPTFTARGGATMDLRTVATPMMNELLGRAFIKHGYSKEQVYNADGSLRMLIGTGQKDFKGKTMWSDLNGVFQYLVSELRNEAKTGSLTGEAAEHARNKYAVGELAKDPIFSKFISYDEKTGNIIFDNTQYKKVLTTSKKSLLGASGKGSGGHFGVDGMLKAMVGFGQARGFYEKGDYFKEAGGKLELLKPLIYASEFGPSSVIRYQGDFSNEGAGMRFSYKELDSLRGTIGRMRHWDTEGKYTGEIDILEKAFKALEGRMEHLKQPVVDKDGRIIAPGYGSYQRNIDALRSFQPSATSARKDLLETGLLLTEADLRNFSTELGYDGSSIYATDGRDLAIAEVARRRKQRYEELLKTNGAEWLKSRGINSEFDIAVGLDTGDRRYNFIDEAGKSHIGGLAMLGLGMPEATELFDENGNPRQFAYRANDIDEANNTIIRGYMALMAAGRGDTSAAKYAGSLIGSGTQAIRHSILNGSVYEQMHKLAVDDSAYLLMQSMNTEAGALFKELYGSKFNGKLPSYIMSTADAKTLLGGRSDAELDSLYRSVFGKKFTGKGGKDSLIKSLIAGMTLESKGFKGVADTSHMAWRSPTLKMFDDILGGGMVFSNIVTPGNYLVNPDTAAAFKGDFDGDRIAIFQALQDGDIAGAQNLIEDYFGKLTSGQYGARLADGEVTGLGSGKLAEMNSVLDEAAMRAQAAAANAGYKGAGIYGNLLYGISEGLNRSGLGFGSLLTGETGSQGALASNMARALAGTLYQEGINIKNTKASGDNPAAVLDDIMYRVGKGGTWNSFDGLLSLLTVAENAGILGDNGVFKGNVAANAGLFGTGLLTDQDWAYYADMARKAADSDYFKGNKKGRAALLKEAKGFDDKTATNFSKELVSFIISSSGEGGLNYFLGKNGTSIGDIVSHLYNYIEGHSDSEWRVTTRGDEAQDFDEETKQILSLWGDSRAKDIEIKKKDPNVSIADWAMDPLGSWSALNLDFIARSKGKNLLGSPHSVDDLLLGTLNSVNTSPAFNETMKRIFESNGEIPIKELLPSGKSGQEAVDFTRMMGSSLKGNVIHVFQELITNALIDGTKGLDPNDADSIYNILKDSPEYQMATQKLVAFLKATGAAPSTIEKELGSVLTRAGVQSSAFLQQAGFSSDEYNKLRSQAARRAYARRLTGTEIVLPGQLGNFRTTGAMDAASLRDGILTVTDYKNTKNGTLNAADMLQNLQYVNFLKTWKENIAASGATSAEAYFKSNPDNPYVRAFKNSFEYMAGSSAQRALEDRRLKGENIPNEAAFIEEFKRNFLQEQYSKIYRLYEDVVNAKEIRGLLQYTSGEGVLRQYGINPEDTTIKGIMTKAYYTGDRLSEEDQKQLTSRASELLPMQFSFEGQYGESLQKYIKARKDLLEIEKELYLVTEKMKRASAMGNTEAVESLTLAKEELTAKQAELATIEQAAKLEHEGFISRGLGKKGLLRKEAMGADEAYKQAVTDLDDYFEKLKLDEDKTNRVTEFGKFFNKEIVPEYKDTYGKGTSLSRRQAELASILKDPLLSKSERAEYESELDSVTEKIKESDAAIEHFSSMVRELSTVIPESTTVFNDLKEGLEEARKTLLKEDEEKRERLAARQARAREYKLGREIDSATKGVVGARYSVWELDQRLEQTDDPLTRQFLENEREARLELLRLSEDRLTAIKEEYTGKDGKLNPAFQALLDKSQYNADLQYKIKTNDYLAKHAPKDEGGNGILGGLGAQVGLYFKRLFAGGLIMRAMGKIRQELQKIVQQAKELDKVMTNVRIVTNGSIEDTRNLMSAYSALGKELGVTTKEVAQSGIEWMRQGYEAAEATKLITASLYLSKLGMIDSTQATKSLTSALKGFKLEASEAMSVVDKLTAIDLKAATSAGDIAEGLAQFANLGSLAGVDIDQAAAYVATIADVTQMSGSSAGQALKTIISRYGNVKAGAYNKLNVDSETSDTAENLNDVERVLSKIGISIRKTNLQFKDFDEVLAEIAEKWDTLDNVSKKAIATAFAGIRQQESFVTLLENWTKYEQLLDTSRTSSGTAETKYASYQESLEAATNRLTATIEDFVNRAEISELLKTLTEIATRLAEFIPWLIKWGPQIFAAIQNLKILSGNSWLQRLGNSEKVQKFFGKIGDNYSLAWRMAQEGATDEFSAFSRTGKKSVWSKIKMGASTVAGGTRRTLLGGNTKKEEAFLAKEQKAREERLKVETAITKESSARLDLSKLETKYKDDVVISAGVEKLKKGETLTYAQLSALAEKESLTDEQMISLIRKGSITSEDAVKLLRSQGVSDEARIEAMRKAGAVSGSGGGGGGGAGAAAGKGVKMSGAAIGVQAGLAAASYVMNQAMAGISAWNSSGHTHSTDFAGMESVTSSKAAHEKGRAITTAWTLAVPFFGQMIGEAIADNVMKEMDRARDQADYKAKTASGHLEALAGVQSDFTNIKELASSTNPDDATVRNASVENYLNTMYSYENMDLRLMLEANLREIAEELELNNAETLTLNSLMEDYQKGDSRTKERIAKALEIAQKRAQRSEQQEARMAEQYAYQERIGDKSLRYNATQAGFTKDGITQAQEAHAVGTGVGTGIGTGVGIAAGGMAATALTIAGIAAVTGASTGPVGWIVGGIISALAAIAGGIFAGIEAAKAERERQKEEQRRRQAWENMLTSDKLTFLSYQEEGIRKQIEETGEDEVDKLKELNESLEATVEYKKALQDYAAWIAQKNAEDNKLALEEALLLAKDKNGEFLMDLTLGQLRTMNMEEVYKALADAVGNNLIGMNAYNNQGELTEEFISMATQILKEDQDIAQLLTGETLTLSQALQQLDANDRFEAAILQNFATALHTDLEGLQAFVTGFGNLTLGELLQSTTELTDTVANYVSLVSDVSDGHKSISEWMNQIIKQFPDLIQYMSDIPSLMGVIVEKIHELSNRYIQTQWDELASNKDYFDTVIKSDILNAFTDENERKEMEALLNSSGAYDMNSLRKWFNGQDLNDEKIKKLYEAFANAGASTQLISDVYKELLSNYIDVQVQLMDKVIDSLTEQRDMLQQINKEREYENRLIEARNRLEEAQNEKQRVYRAGVGWVYEANQQKITEAQKQLEEVSREKEISALTEQIEILTATRDEWSNIWDKQSFELAQTQAQKFEEEFLPGIHGDLDGLGTGLGTISGDITNVTSLLTSWNLNDIFDKIVGDDGLLAGISTKVSELTQAILEQDQKDMDTIVNGNPEGSGDDAKSLTELWNEYVNSIGTENENDALKAFTDRYQQFASNGGNTQAWYESLGESGQSLKGTALEIGNGGYNNYKVNIPKIFEADGHMLKTDGAETLSPDAATSIWSDMKTSANGGKDAGAARMWDIKDGKMQGDGTTINELDPRLRPSPEDTDLWDYAERVKGLKREAVIGGLDGEIEWAYMRNGQLYRMGDMGTKQWKAGETVETGGKGDKKKWKINKDVYGTSNDPSKPPWYTLDGKDYYSWEELTAAGVISAAARGLISKPRAGMSLINELGTEAIVTPQGTLTALPAKTGVVPADITKNLWALGELAPGILRALQMPVMPGGLSASTLAPVYDDSFTVGNISMTVNADGTFDAEKFIQSLKDRIALTRNNR